jgi:hypothetical protein
MTTQPTCSQWSQLVQVAEAHDIQFTYVEHLGEPYMIDRHERLIYLDGDTELGPDSYLALAAALTHLTHQNVAVLHPPRRDEDPRSLGRSS